MVLLFCLREAQVCYECWESDWKERTVRTVSLCYECWESDRLERKDGLYSISVMIFCAYTSGSSCLSFSPRNHVHLYTTEAFTVCAERQRFVSWFFPPPSDICIRIRLYPRMVCIGKAGSTRTCQHHRDLGFSQRPSVTLLTGNRHTAVGVAVRL